MSDMTTPSPWNLKSVGTDEHGNAFQVLEATFDGVTIVVKLHDTDGAKIIIAMPAAVEPQLAEVTIPWDALSALGQVLKWAV